MRKLFLLISSGRITLAGYSKGKIYGTLDCAPGKRMNIKHRVFFANEQEAVSMGYRPCGHCMKIKYKEWRESIIQK